MKRLILVLSMVVLLLGCGRTQEPVLQMQTAPTELHTVVTETTQPPTVTVAAEQIQQEAEVMAEAPLPPVSVVLTPEASGEQETRCDVAVVDYSHCQDGYVMVCHFGQTDRRLKVLLKGPATTYNYNLPQGQWTVFPLSDGNGSYQVGVYRNTEGNKYATVMTSQFEVALTDEFSPFLRPNQYVNYVDAPKTMAMSGELCVGLEHPLEKVAAIYDYVIANLSYDYDKASTVKSGYLPVLDEVLEAQKGICFDYAALMTAMLRMQEVPCKLVVGYAGNVYHAWISVWTEENGWVDGAIFFDGHAWRRMDPTFASSSKDMEQTLDFIEHGTYTVKYLY